MPRNDTDPCTIQIITCTPTGRTLHNIRSTPIEKLRSIHHWKGDTVDRHKARTALMKYGPEVFTYTCWPSTEAPQIFPNRAAAEATLRTLIAEATRVQGETFNGRRSETYED